MLLNIGVDYKRAPLAVLDALTLRAPEEFYRILQKSPKVRGSLILQTCNRVEFYLDTDGGEDVAQEVLWHWALEARFKLSELTRLVERRVDDAVVDHLVRLGSGLESMLVGEPQILGQLKKALMAAASQGANSELIVELFEKAAQAASKIREETEIGKGTVSLGSAAVKLAEESFGPIRDANLLLIGTGHVGMLVMKALKARNLAKLLVAGRTHERAESFCRTYGGDPIGFRQIPEHLPQTDVIIVATKATSFLLTKSTLEQPTVQRRTKLTILDLSSPRNVSPDVTQLNGVTLRTIDDLRGVANEALARRRAIVKQAEPLVRQKVESITALMRRSEAEPIVSDIYRRADQIRTHELQRALSRLGLSPDQEKVVQSMSVSLVEKILAPPVGNLRKAAEKGRIELLTVAGEIFGGD